MQQYDMQSNRFGDREQESLLLKKCTSDDHRTMWYINDMTMEDVNVIPGSVSTIQQSCSWIILDGLPFFGVILVVICPRSCSLQTVARLPFPEPLHSSNSIPAGSRHPWTPLGCTKPQNRQQVLSQSCYKINPLVGSIQHNSYTWS